MVLNWWLWLEFRHVNCVLGFDVLDTLILREAVVLRRWRLLMVVGYSDDGGDGIPKRTGGDLN